MKTVSFRASTLAGLSLFKAAALLGSLVGCAEEATEVPTRSLEQSGPMAFICLAEHGKAAPGLPLSTCNRAQTATPYDFSVSADGTPKTPHLYALVTQTTRGEVAVVDMTSVSDSVIDENPSVPGANFLQVGAQPVDVVATPGGTAAFVAVAEVGREGIYALPSTRLRPCLVQPAEGASAEEKAKCAPPVISAWPSCSLPSAPGSMVLVPDPAVGGAIRASCSDAAYSGAPAEGKNGDIGLEGNGRQKLVVTMPDLGGIAVFDAQAILDREPGGGDAATFEACVPEVWLPLTADVAPPVDVKPIPPGPACVVPEKLPPVVSSGSTPRPAGLAYAEDRLYIADLSSPVVHVIDLPTPCAPKPLPSLFPTSLEDPKRVVTTTRVAVTPELTTDLRRYLYAVDAYDGATMVFDISDAGGSRFPLTKSHPEWNPFQPADRIRFASPVRDLMIFQRDIPAGNPVTGTAPEGTRCDPDPRVTCDGTSATCDPGALYRTATDYSTGAGPTRLRGSFAVLLLTAGQIAIVDIDDLDGACRVPKTFDAEYGCPPASFVRECASAVDCAASEGCDAIGRCVPASCTNDVQDGEEEGLNCGGPSCSPCSWVGSGEVSCNVVVPNAPRSTSYVLTSEGVGRHGPGIQTAPFLSNADGALIQTSNAAAPRLHASLSAAGLTRSLVVGTKAQTIGTDGFFKVDGETKNTIVMTLEDPRAHIVDQPWGISYEGGLPGFSDKSGVLGDDGYTLTDSNSRFCDRGVQSRKSVQAILDAQGEQGASALDYADVVQITNELPGTTDVHWASADDGVCRYDLCKTYFGVAGAPQPPRDVEIEEAYQDRLQLVESTVDVVDKNNQPTTVQKGDLVRCCFPGTMTFNVRAKGQWIAIGAASGFLHHVIADPTSGVCRDSCDPDVQRLNGRVRTAPSDAFESAADKAAVTDGGKFAFVNPMFRFVITSGAEPPKRDMQFSFVTQGSFAPLVANLAGVTSSILPQALRYVPPLGEIAITDGQLEGLLTVNLSSFVISRQYY